MNADIGVCKIGIADDHKLIIEGIKAMLEGEVYEPIFSANSLIELNDLLRLNELDILLLDINFNGKTSLDHIERYKHLYPVLKIVICTSYDSGVFVSDAISKGADGYLLKDITKCELMSLLEQVLEGETVIHDRINYKSHKPNPELEDAFSKYSSLTTREKEITVQLLDLKSTDQIAAILHISPNTVHTHRKNIFKKLSIHSTADLIKKYHKQV